MVNCAITVLTAEVMSGSGVSWAEEVLELFGDGREQAANRIANRVMVEIARDIRLL